MASRLGRIVLLVLLIACVAHPVLAANRVTIQIAGSEQMVNGAWDSGTITVTVNGRSESVSYGQYSTAASIASALAVKFTKDCACTGGTACAKATGNSITFQAKNGFNIDYVGDSGSTASFGVDDSNGNPITGSGGGGGSISGTLYSYTGTGYEANGNVTDFNDSVTGAWHFSYDSLNRLSIGTPNSGLYQGQPMGWSYDPFGNRTAEDVSGTHSYWANYNSNNQVSSSSNGGYVYDAAGNITNDGVYNYLYDFEGRLCAVRNPLTGSNTQYIYDADGNRIAKGSTNSFSCDSSSNGFTLIEQYIVGQSGELVSKVDGQGNWLQSNVYAQGQRWATYDSAGLHFNLTDPLETRRVQVAADLSNYTDYPSLPFGNGVDSTDFHFTGKERDAESGNDYFGARYYASSMGRFLSPDEPFVDQDPSDPQSWNLYGYVRNNPLSNVDDDGRDCIYADGNGGGYVQRGDCTNAGGKDDNGIFVDGTIDVNSFKYNADNNSSSFSYTTDSGGIGRGVLQGPDLNGGFAAGSLGASVFGAQNASTWNNSFGVVNTAGNLAVGVMAPWAGAIAGCTSGDSGGACAANLAISVLPEVAELKVGATLLKEAAAAGKKGAEILAKAGGAAQAAKDFEALQGAERTLGTVRVKTLSDGTKAVLRGSSDGRPTLEIQHAGGGVTKIRYN